MILITIFVYVTLLLECYSDVCMGACPDVLLHLYMTSYSSLAHAEQDNPAIPVHNSWSIILCLVFSCMIKHVRWITKFKRMKFLCNVY